MLGADSKFKNQFSGRRSGARCSWVAVLTCAVFVNGAAATDVFQRVAIITTSQVAGGVVSPAFGCGTFEIDTVANTVRYYIVFTGLSAPETAAHIHGFVDPGVGGGVVHPLPAGSPKIGVWTYAEVDEGDILAGKTYVNIHTAAFPAGEIRGQIVGMVAVIDEAQVNPPTGSAGSGFGLFNIDTAANTLSYYIEYGGLGAAETVAHIHAFAVHGMNAAPLHPLPAGSPKIGVWNYDQTQESAILDGLTYVNIHSVAFIGGEIRGQVVGTVVPIDGRQEVPPVVTPGAGCGLISIDRAADLLSYDIRTSGLIAPATAAHIHGYVPRGVSGGVQHPLPAGARKLGRWIYPGGDEPRIWRGLSYINVHSAAHPAGEIRGQIEFRDDPCDMNCDGAINAFDIEPFLDLLFGAPAPCAPCTGDANGDGTVDAFDIEPFLDCLFP